MNVILYNFLALSVSMLPVLFVLILARPALDRWFRAGWRYVLWLVVSIRLLVPFSPAWFWSVPLPRGIEAGFYGTPLEMGASLAQGAFSEPLFSEGLFGLWQGGLAEGLLLLYAAGILFSLGRLFGGHWRFCRMLRRHARPCELMQIHRALEQVKEKLGIRRSVAVVICEKTASPMVAGLFRPVLVLPGKTYSKRELEFILTHEMTHLLRRDIFYKLALFTVRALHWWNPLVYLMVRAALSDMEISCDSRVLEKEDRQARKDYGYLILRMAQKEPEAGLSQISTGFVRTGGALAFRVEGILDTRSKRKGVFAMALAAALVLFSGSLFTFGGVEGTSEQPEGLLGGSAASAFTQTERAGMESAGAFSQGQSAGAAVQIPGGDTAQAATEDPSVVVIDLEKLGGGR